MNRIVLTLGLLVTLTQTSHANNWPNWRGPSQNNVAPGTNYPTEWSSTKNVLWKVELPGKGSSTPIVWEDRIFVTAPGNDQNLVIALDRQGKQLWETTVGEVKRGKHRKASGANPSPVTDGKHVYAYFKSGDLACLNFAGKIVWQHNLQKLYGEDTLWWDLGTSPVLTKDAVVVACMQTGDSYLAALDKATGKQLWKQDRNLGAPVEAAQSYSTPIVLDQKDKQTLIVLGADHVTAHNGQTGEELWRVGGLNPTGHKYFRSISSPVVAGDVVVAPYARGGSLTAIRMGGSGDVTDTHVLWEGKDASADVPSPAASNGRVYVLTDKGKVACLTAANGKELWTGQVERHRNSFSSSPVLAGGHIYLTRENGTTYVLKQGEKFEQVAKNQLDEGTVATPVFVDGQLLLRTNKHLYCIGQK